MAKEQPKKLSFYRGFLSALKRGRGEAEIAEDSESEKPAVPYDKELLHRLIEKGKIPKDLGDLLVTACEEREKLEIALSSTPSLTPEQKEEIFEKILPKTPEEIKKRELATKYLVSIKGALEEERAADRMLPLFNKNLNKEEFGLTKAVMDRLNYLPELLDNAKLHRISEDSDSYKISSELTNSTRAEKLGIGAIGLEYYFVANDEANAMQIFNLYRDEMTREALKIFLAYWKLANSRGMFDYSADITEIMQQSADINRESYFSVKEKKRFWALTKLLENTKLTLRVPYKNKKGNRGKVLTVEHRLLEISAREDWMMENEEGGYPNKIKVRVLDPQEFQEKAHLATAIAKGTTRLPPQDIMLALTLQTRASQRRHAKQSQYDEAFLIERANLQKTRDANPRMARSRLKEKLNRIKDDARAIKDWQASKGAYLIEHNKPHSESGEEEQT